MQRRYTHALTQMFQQGILYQLQTIANSNDLNINDFNLSSGHSRLLFRGIPITTSTVIQNQSCTPLADRVHVFTKQTPPPTGRQTNVIQMIYDIC